MEQINLNLIPNGILAVCHVSQYDNTGRKIRFHLFNGSDTYALSGTETITLRIRKTNGEILIFDIANTASDYIELTVLQQMSDVSGVSVCEFRLTDSGLDIGSFNFKMKVEPDAFDGNLSISEVSGPIATFETDLAEDLIKLDVDLEPIQDLHGYDSPWPAGGGKNLLGNFYDWTAWSPTLAAYGDCPTSNSNKGLLLNTKPNTTYTISIELVPNLEQVPKYLYVASANGTNVSTRLAYITNGATLMSATFTFTTTANDIYYLRVNTSYVNSQATFDTEIGNKVKWIQLEAGSTATSYAPYSNICPISGHDSAILSRVGKNWLNLNRTNIITNAGLYPSTIRTFTENDIWIGISRNNYFNNSRISSYSIDSNKVTVLTTAGGYGVGFPIRCKPSTAYKMSNKEGYNLFNTGFFDADGNYLSYTTSATFTTPNNCAWILVVFSGTANIEASYINPQLELGSTATDYEPYESDPTPVTVNFGQTVYKGKLYSEQRKMLVTHILKTFDGSSDESWRFNDTGSDKNRAYIKIEDAKGFSDIQSNYLKNYSAHTAYPPIYNGWVNSSSQLLVGVPTSITSLTDWTAFLALNSLDVLYELAEPFFIDLTQVQTASIDSTPVASFETTLAMPLSTSEHSFSASQAEGIPTPDSPIPITGISEITAYRTGKNLTNITISATNHWGTDTQELVSFLNTLPVGVYTISNKYRINELPGNNKVQHGRFYITALVDGSQTPVLPYSVVTDTSPAIGKIYQESGTFEITASNKGKFNHAYRYCDQDTTHTGNDRGSYICYDIQLEKASSATPYEPYSGESITVSLGGTYYGGKLVQSEDGSRKIVADMAIDSISSSYLSGLDSNYIGYTSSVNVMSGHPCVWVRNWKYPPNSKGFVSGGIKAACNAFKISMNNSSITSTQYRIYFDVNGMNITSVSDFISAIFSMEQNNKSLDVCYELETLLEINLPDGDPLTTIAGENNVYCNTGDTALTYYYNMVADPIRIPALVGTNNVYSDAGDVDVEYYTTVEGGND